MNDGTRKSEDDEEILPEKIFLLQKFQLFEEYFVDGRGSEEISNEEFKELSCTFTILFQEMMYREY